MMNKQRALKRLLFFMCVIVVALPVLMALAHISGKSAEQDYHIAIAFGFHVNLYHSFRNDTNDEQGFGKDIRIIRHTIKTLDEFNREGVPVKGIWDMDNMFSLQDILPHYAPDIIEDIKRRVRENGDEVILMSYNNGLVSSMTPRELDCAVKWAISNPWESGIEDMFGAYTPIVRPQEMMTTPGNFSVYKKYGIKAVSLYYSETPFDAFRVFIRRLTREEAHNPVMYRNPETGEDMIIIPTYHPGDLMEHVSLKHWADELHDLQMNGSLRNDALIFINFDADSEFWQGVDVPRVLEWFPNTGGLKQLINDVKDVPYVRFTSLEDYTQSHDPVGEFSFFQDTADGSFNGYSSWAEKADSPLYWKAIQRNRRACAAAEKAAILLHDRNGSTTLENLINFSELIRLRALSTTNFGMATPYLACQREQIIHNLMDSLDLYSEHIENEIQDGFQNNLKTHPIAPDRWVGLTLLGTVMILDAKEDIESPSEGSRFIHVTRPPGYSEDMALIFVRTDGKRFPALNLGVTGDKKEAPVLTLYVSSEENMPDGIYALCGDLSGHEKRTQESALRINHQALSNGRLSIRFGEGRIEGIFLDGEQVAEQGSLVPYMTWGQQTYTGTFSMAPHYRGSLSCDLTGFIRGPEQQTVSEGVMDYRFTLIDDLPYVMVQGHVQYPGTRKTDTFKPDLPGLTRPYDANWKDVAPMEIRFMPQGSKQDPLRVLKRNYLNVSSEYALDYFRHDDRNLNLDSVNNHITESYVGVITGNKGMAIAMDSQVRSNFAFSPLKMTYAKKCDAFSVRANPFGTYTGRQYRPFTWGNGNGYEATLLAGEQFAGAGPTYNGKDVDFSLLLAFFNGSGMPDHIKKDMDAYANPPLVVSGSRTGMSSFAGQDSEERLYASFERGFDNPTKAPTGSHHARETHRPSKPSPGIPFLLGIKVFWANIYALLTS